MSLTLSALLVLALAPAAAPQNPAAPAPKPLPVVSIDALKPMIPTVAGWTRGEFTGDLVRVSDEAGYSFATAEFTNGPAKVLLTVGDTFGVGDCQMALAAMIAVLPEGYSQQLKPATEIMRFTYEGFQASSKWDAEKLVGEFAVLVNGRFVVKAEGTGIASLDTLREFVAKVDLKKLADLKAAK